MEFLDSELPFDGLYLVDRPWFPYLCTEVENWSWQTEGHPHYNFWAALEGEGYLTVEAETYRIQPGMFFVFSPHQRVAAVHYSGPRITRFSAHFLPLTGAVISDAVPGFPVMGGDVGSVALFKRQLDVIMRLSADRKDEALLQRRMYDLIARVCWQQDVAAQVILHPKVSEAIRMMREDLVAIESMDAIARQLGWSRSHFDREFTKQVGQAPKQFLLNCKMIEARRYLESGSLRVGEIAELLGYRDIYFFSRQFKGFFGMSPVQYRKSLQQD